MKKIFLSLILVVAVVFVTGCGSSNKLIGKWTGPSDSGLVTTFEFKKDGKINYSNEFGFKSTGKYEIKKDKVKISLESWDETKEYKFEVKDKKLSLTATDKYSPSYPKMEKE